MKNSPNICFVEDSGRNPGLPNTAGTLGLGANSHCNVEFTKKGRQTARTFVTAGIADPTPGCAGAKKNPFYGSAGLLRAERRAGEMLSQMEKHPGGLSQDVITPPQTLTELGVTPMQSHRWQTEASLPELDLIGQVTANPKHIHHNNPDGNNVTIRGNASTYGSADFREILPESDGSAPVKEIFPEREGSADLVVVSHSSANGGMAKLATLLDMAVVANASADPSPGDRCRQEKAPTALDLIGQVTANPVGMNQYTEGHNNVMTQTQGNASTYASADLRKASARRGAGAFASADFGYSDDNPEAAIIVKGGMSDDNPKAGIVGRTTASLPGILVHGKAGIPDHLAVMDGNPEARLDGNYDPPHEQDCDPLSIMGHNPEARLVRNRPLPNIPKLSSYANCPTSHIGEVTQSPARTVRGHGGNDA